MPVSCLPLLRSGLIAGGFLLGGLIITGCQTPPGDEDSEVAETPASTGDAPIPDEQTAVAEAVSEAEERAREARLELERERQGLQLAAWQHVKAIIGMWDELPPEYFPGLTTLVSQIEELREEIEQEDTIRVGMIDPLALTTNNPAFWRAVMETNPEDPVVAMLEQMLWVARGDFDRAIWLIELNRYGPALPTNIHKLIYSMTEELSMVRARESTRRNRLLENVPGDQVAQVIATARAFRPQDADWALMSIVVGLQMGGVPPNDLDSFPDQVDQIMKARQNDWQLVARANPMVGAQLSPERKTRAMAQELSARLADLAESRGAFGGRDLDRLGDALADAGFYAEALLAKQRAVALRGFSVPSDMQMWWTWLPNLIGPEETEQLRQAADFGLIRPVTFFQTELGPEGVSMLPLHPILTDRNLRRLQEVQRRLETPDQTDSNKTRTLITLAETLGHLGRWDEARAALNEIPPEFAEAGAPMEVWVSLWSGDVDGIGEKMAKINQAIENESPALPNQVGPALPALVEAAQGNWAAGAGVFVEAAQSEELSNEYRTYYTLMASAFTRLAGADGEADALIDAARELAGGHDWVAALVAGMAGETPAEVKDENITEITEAGRVCEQRFYRAFQRDISDVRQRALLEACVATGVVDFVEYTASLLRLRELDPERWDPQTLPETGDENDSEAEDEDDWTRGAEASWSIPS